MHPWQWMENLDRSVLVTTAGTLGSGKPATAGLLARMPAQAGGPAIPLDPAGVLRQVAS